MQLFLAVPEYKQAHPVHLAAREATVRHFGDAAVVHVQKRDSLSRARTNLLAEYLERKRPWTHLVQIDDDQSWAPEHLERLVELGRPAVCLPCAYKFEPDHPWHGRATAKGLPGEAPDADGVLKVRYLGGGFIVWRADAIEALCERHPELAFDTDYPDAEPRPTFDLWHQRIVDRRLMPEDYSISSRAADAGIPLACWLGACSPHWENPPADPDDPATWRCWVPAGYSKPTLIPRRTAP